MIQRLSRVTQLVNGGNWTRSPGVNTHSPSPWYLLKIIPKCYLYGSEQEGLAISRDSMQLKILRFYSEINKSLHEVGTPHAALEEM